MPKSGRRTQGGTCCEDGCCDTGCACRQVSTLECCQVEAIVRLDERGQMVLPKDVRKKLGFRPDQKLAVVSWKRGPEVCCVTLQSAEELASVVRRTYGPLLAPASNPR